MKLSEAVAILTAGIENPDPTAPVGNCPECGVTFMSYRGQFSQRFTCQHPVSERCRYAFKVIAREETLEAMRETARAWIEENKK
jgi:hypothetical protein